MNEKKEQIGNTMVIVSCVVIMCIAILDVLLLCRTARHDREWEVGQEKLPAVSISGETVVIENFRDFRWDEDGSVTTSYRREVFDLATLDGIDVIVSHFAPFEGMAHILLSFRFSDGKNMVVSVESRRETHEKFSPWRGLFRQYEMIYVVGSEQDLIGLRTHARHEDVYIYPTQATREQAQDLLTVIAQDVHAISQKPRFYNTIYNNCTNAITRHVMQIADVRFPWSYHMLLPGLVDGVLYEKGIIPHDQPFAQIKEQYFSDPEKTSIDDPLFSQNIRTNQSSMP